ncbi:phage tail tape measure protein, partial [Sporosarcina contaminans]
AFQREIVETESKLKHFETQLASSQSKLKAFGDSAVEAGQKMKDAGAKITSAGKELSTKVTAPLVGVAAIAAKIGSDFEAGMSKVQAISGASGDEIVLLTEKAREMGATTQFSASEAADALSYMAMAGWKTNDMLSGIDGIMALAAASGEDLALTADILTDGLTAFGLSAADSGRFADVLAAASSNANTNVAMLGESFKYVAPLAGAMGYTAEDTALALGLMANAGIKSSQAGTSLKTMFANLAKPTKAMKNAMEDLGISLTDSQGNMKTMDTVLQDLRTAFGGLSETQQAQYSATIFGKEAMAGALSIINASEADYNKLSKAINNSDGAAQQMAKTMTDNLQGRLKEMQSALEEAAISIYNNLQPALEKIVAFIQKLADWFNNLSPAAQNTIIAIAGVVAAIGPLLVIIGTLVASLGAVFTAIGTFSSAMAVVTTGAAAATPAVGALAAVISALTGPIGIAVAAIAGITAALVLAYNKVEWFRDGVDKVWEAIKSATQKAFEAVKETISTVIEAAVKFGSEQLETFKKFWDENGKAIMDLVKKYFNLVLSD